MTSSGVYPPGGEKIPGIEYLYFLILKGNKNTPHVKRLILTVK
jgi:hypothetical protein